MNSDVRRILVVDDNEAIHQDFQKILASSAKKKSLHDMEASLFGQSAPQQQTYEFQVFSAYQGQEALDLVKREIEVGDRYAVAFVDVRMPPGIDGIVTTKALLALDPDIQIVICTAHSDYSWSDMIATLGETDRVLILRKPFDPIEARQLACALHQKRQATRELRLRAERSEMLAEERTEQLSKTQAQLERLNDEMVEHEQRLHYLATHDALTGLPNRNLMLGRIELAMARLERSGIPFAAMLVDIYRFRSMVDTYGHETADDVLNEIAIRIRAQVRQFDVLARVGQDEFVVLVEEVVDPKHVRTLAERIHEISNEAVNVAGQEISVSFCIGVTFGTRGYMSPEQVLRDVNIAMIRARDQGKGYTEILHTTDRLTALRRLKTESDLARAVAQGQFVLHFQPIVSLTQPVTLGVEALVRWRHPDRGLLMPDEFIDVAEESLHIVALGDWVLRQSLEQIKQINEELGQSLFVSVNVSVRQLLKPDFVDKVKFALEDTQTKSHMVKLELTETTMVESTPKLLGRLETLDALGVALGIDDFGTGYSSLAVLQRTPVRYLKIDKSFVRDIPSSEVNLTMVSAVSQVAKAMKIQVVAEGIETELQREAICNLGCEMAQGYLFSKPLSFEDLKVFLKNPPYRLSLKPTEGV